MKRILFHRVNEPYGEFSNFAPYTRNSKSSDSILKFEIHAEAIR